jgi:hypothetical protein
MRSLLQQQADGLNANSANSMIAAFAVDAR